MKSTKKLLVLAIITIMACALLCSCEKSKTSNANNTTEKKEKNYTIGICQPENNEYYNQITRGFSDGINDYFQDSNLNIVIRVGDNANTNQINDELLASSVSLIFEEESNALLDISSKTTEIPIVATGVMDFCSTLNIQKDEKDTSTSVYTKSNITGISTLPNIPDTLSMLIEATPNLQNVGILYKPIEQDSIYQVEEMKKLLTEANIPYNEYIDESTTYNKTLITNACNECSCIYIPANSSLTNYIDSIESITSKAQIPTIGGDEYLGNSTLVSMYYDPYDIGYKCAKIAYNILEEDSDPGKIEIESLKHSNGQKLYNKKIAEKLNASFPKSFKEINTYFSTYIPGSNTTRVEKDK